jgi:hypothetical protein
MESLLLKKVRQNPVCRTHFLLIDRGEELGTRNAVLLGGPVAPQVGGSMTGR